MNKLKSIIQRWLFGTDVMVEYFHLLSKAAHANEELIYQIEQHQESLRKWGEDLDLLRKVLMICRNHGINVDEELKHTKFEVLEVKHNVVH